MATFNSKTQGQVKRNGQHDKADMKRVERPEFARDDLSGAFAGKQNKAPAAEYSGKATHLSARQTPESKAKTPKR